MPTVLVRHDLPIAGAITGRRDGLAVETADDSDAVLDALSDADVLVINPGSWRDDYVAGLAAGDWVQATSAGYDAFPLDTLAERDVAFTNAAGNYGPVVAEHVFALAFAFSRRLPELLDRQRAREWDRTVGLELTDWTASTLTVYGLGNLGEAVAERALAFGMSVYGVKRDPDEYEGCLARDRVLGPDGWRAVLPETDLLVATVPLTAETRGSIDGAVFTALPDDAVLINVARGPVVDEPALLDALQRDQIRGAGLDVFEVEPLPADSPLWARDDVIVTPHVGGRSASFTERFADLFLANYDRWRAGDPLENRIV